MKNLISTLKNKVSKLDNVDKFGVAFGILVFLPLLTILVIYIVSNGAQML